MEQEILRKAGQNSKVQIYVDPSLAPSEVKWDQRDQSLALLVYRRFLRQRAIQQRQSKGYEMPNCWANSKIMTEKAAKPKALYWKCTRI
ncbi:hypothetical protein EYF80_020550 [Liparis tanakae]|uniref:Uncharacterized protein n=1 Tax=Liparis tanakae TaxID=230148 RepID=A0A4Z2HW84_9TELE|nr:hypothetical protein EYF80_020550 [Liparis tanakae]